KTPLRLGFSGSQTASDHNALAGYVGRTLPLVLDVPADTTAENLSDMVAAELAALDVRRGYPSDLALRTPCLSTEPFTVAIVAASGLPRLDGAPVTFVLPQDGGEPHLQLDTSRIPAETAEALQKQLAAFLASFAADGTTRIADMRLM